MKRRDGVRRAAIAGILIVGIALGALREFLFINLNYQIDHLARHTRFSYAHSLFIHWTTSMELPGLIRLKWIMGAAFTGVLIKNSIAISMDGRGAWRDNVFVERLWRAYSNEAGRVSRS